MEPFQERKELNAADWCLNDFMYRLDLLYEGPLPSDTWNGKKPKTEYKQCLRSVFHQQLAAWMPLVNWPHYSIEHRPKGRWSDGRLVPAPPAQHTFPISPFIELGGQKYIPLVTADHRMSVDLDFTILSRQCKARHDTDNRVKMLRDALTIPHSDQEVEGYPVSTDVCFCLLEDDNGSIVGKETSVSRDLLKPLPSREHEVVVWIQVTLTKIGL